MLPLLPAKQMSLFAVFRQHACTVAFEQTLYRPVVLIFLHVKTVVAGLFFDDFRLFANVLPGNRRSIGIQSRLSIQIRIVIENRRADGVRYTDLTTVYLCQFQDVRHKVGAEIVRIARYLFAQCRRRNILEVLIKIF